MVSTLAFDMGASSGRAVVGQFDGTKLNIVDTYRFPNEPVYIHQHMYWDILRLFHEIKQGLIQTRLKGHKDIQSIGIDAWGVDFGLLDKNGELLGNPYHYRDAQNLGMLEEVTQIIPQDMIFRRTGIQFIPFNTIYQLYALKKYENPCLLQAETLLMIPELLRYFLTGERLSEWTITSTTQLCTPHTRSWDYELIEHVGIPGKLFCEPAIPGTLAGKVLTTISQEIGFPELPVIAVAEHDTASAIVAVPTEHADFAYLSCGTWSLLGTEIQTPIINAQALTCNVTNEGGFNNTIRLLKNVTGLWLIQECRRIWKNEGKSLSFEEEKTLLEAANPFQSFINPDHLMFMNPSHMPKQIQQYCRETEQPVPQTPGALLRCIVESLALRYRFVLEQIENLVQKQFTGLHIVGGGAQNTMLCQYTANALGRPVWAGPCEATAIGNLLVQYMTLGHITDIRQGRDIVRHSFPIHTYNPTLLDQWEQAYKTFCHVTSEQ